MSGNRESVTVPNLVKVKTFPPKEIDGKYSFFCPEGNITVVKLIRDYKPRQIRIRKPE